MQKKVFVSFAEFAFDSEGLRPACYASYLFLREGDADPYGEGRVYAVVEVTDTKHDIQQKIVAAIEAQFPVESGIRFEFLGG